MVKIKEPMIVARELSTFFIMLSTKRKVVTVERTTEAALLPIKIVTRAESKWSSHQMTTFAFEDPLLALTSNLKRFIEEKTVSTNEKKAEAIKRKTVRIKYMTQCGKLHHPPFRMILILSQI